MDNQPAMQTTQFSSIADMLAKMAPAATPQTPAVTSAQYGVSDSTQPAPMQLATTTKGQPQTAVPHLSMFPGVINHDPTPTVNTHSDPRVTDNLDGHEQRPMTARATATAIPYAGTTDHCPRPTATENGTSQPQNGERYTTPTSYAAIINSVWHTPTTEAHETAPFHMKLYDDVRLSTVPNYMKVKRIIPSQIKCDAWDTALKDYHDKEICQFMHYGWPVSFTASQPLISTPVNHTYATRHPDAIKKFLKKELEMKAILGPYHKDPFTPWTKVSPLMTHDKLSGVGKRVIIDLSFPPGQSVNDGIQRHAFQSRPFTYTLPTPLYLVEAIVRAGRGAFFGKADLERAYRQMRS